jgi:hypothetical protein
MGAGISKDSIKEYTKFNNNEEAKLYQDMSNAPTVQNNLPDNIDTYGLNTKISLLGLLMNLLNVPNPKIGDSEKPKITNLCTVLTTNIVKNLKSNITKTDKIVHYDGRIEKKIGNYIPRKLIVF